MNCEVGLSHDGITKQLDFHVKSNNVLLFFNHKAVKRPESSSSHVALIFSQLQDEWLFIAPVKCFTALTVKTALCRSVEYISDISGMLEINTGNV